MTLATGTKLGPYEIVSLIGAGGMGEVYRARDARLGREVAVKILPASFAADPERLRRFEQEARAVAALSHPNILALHDIGRHESTPFLVSELLEGESLREVLSRGPVSHRKAVDYAVQIAHGLGAAHGKNIAHRDLKPDNIFITRDGRVKLLDFGLAKPLQDSAADAPTVTLSEVAPATDAGTVLGTASYMSPEQVRGGPVDSRTDIFSFGAVLYEMLSGKRAFKRDTTAETMTAILKEEPAELVDTGVQIPPGLDRIVRHCLEKVPEQRFQSARDLAFDLESLSSLTATGTVASAKSAERRNWWLAGALLAALAIAAAAGWKISSLTSRGGSPQFRQVTYRRGTLGSARFSRDGANILYTAEWEGARPELYTVASDGVGGRTLDVKDARLLSISRSGELAVSLEPTEVTMLLTPGNLARTSNTGGAPKPEIASVQTADYAPDGKALAIVRFVPERQICQLEYPIGKVLYREQAINDLRFSPNGKYLAFIEHKNPSDDRGTVIILRSTGEKVAASPLYDSAQGVAWTPSGDEVWSSSPLGFGQIHAMSLSGKTRNVLTAPGRIWLRDIAPDGRLLVQQGIARRGMIVYLNSGQQQRDISWLDFGYLRDFSNDGKTILFEEEGAAAPIYTLFVRNVDGSPAVPIGEGYGLALSHDKNWALAQKLTEPSPEIWLFPVGPGEARRMNPPELMPLAAAGFLPDGKHIFYPASERGAPPRVWVQDISGGPPHPITQERVVGFRISPDGKWLLAGRRLTINSFLESSLVSMENGSEETIKGLREDEAIIGWTSNNEVYVRSTPDPARMIMHVDKLNPHTGARTAWRDLSMPPIEGVRPEPPIITPDGKSFAFDYRMNLADLYTVSGVR
jgi:serine/threonine protein kinase/WD40 repeat protein